MMSELFVALVPVYEEAALEARLSWYLWMTWPDIMRDSFDLTNVRI